MSDLECVNEKIEKINNYFVETNKSIATLTASVVAMSDQLSANISKFANHEAEEFARQGEYLLIQQENTEAIRQLTESHNIMLEQHQAAMAKSKDMMDAWDAAVGAIKVGGTVGKLLKWVVGVGAAVIALITWFKA